jgi:hypothetical protein
LHIVQRQQQIGKAQEIPSRYDSGRKLDDLIAADGYAECFLGYLGARTVAAMDFSDYEGSTIVHDRNEPVPASLHDRFDVIFDRGTLEHVFNFSVAIRNVQAVLRAGRLLLRVNAANNQLGHGLYQFSPELFWRAFAPETGFSGETMQFVSMDATSAPMQLADLVGTR